MELSVNHTASHSWPKTIHAIKWTARDLTITFHADRSATRSQVSLCYELEQLSHVVVKMDLVTCVKFCGDDQKNQKGFARRYSYHQSQRVTDLRSGRWASPDAK